MNLANLITIDDLKVFYLLLSYLFSYVFDLQIDDKMWCNTNAFLGLHRVNIFFQRSLVSDWSFPFFDQYADKKKTSCRIWQIISFLIIKWRNERPPPTD